MTKRRWDGEIEDVRKAPKAHVWLKPLGCPFGVVRNEHVVRAGIVEGDAAMKLLDRELFSGGSVKNQRSHAHVGDFIGTKPRVLEGNFQF